MRRILACAVAVLATPALSSAALLFSENFDSYANTAALGAAWTLTSNQTLDTAAGNPGQSLNHQGNSSTTAGSNAVRAITGVYPAAGETLVFEADIYDDGLSANKRISAGLRNGAGNSIIEMGMYNSPSHYAVRTVSFAAGSAGIWAAFTGLVNDLGAPITNAPVVGWHRYRAEITPSQVTFTLDLNSDGNINGTYVATPVTQNGTNLFNSIRLGGPSALSSGTAAAPHFAKFDNVSLTLVEAIPEPTTALLAALGLAAAGFRRR